MLISVGFGVAGRKQRFPGVLPELIRVGHGILPCPDNPPIRMHLVAVAVRSKSLTWIAGPDLSTAKMGH